MANSNTRKYLDALIAMGEAIQSAGPLGIPSGHLYALVMNIIGIDAYQQMIRIMVASGKVRNSSDLLVWVGR